MAASAAAALVLYSCAFSISCGIVLFAGPGASFTVEPVAMIALGLICLVFFRASRHPNRPYVLYRAVAPLMGLGFLLMAVPVLPDALGGFCVALGYVLFELLALNDCCNMVRANDSSLLRVMAAAAFAEARGLSRREAEVASFLLAGRTTSFAAEKLFIAESTVRAHVHSIYRKCDVHSRMELMDAFDAFWLEKHSAEEDASGTRAARKPKEPHL